MNANFVIIGLPESGKTTFLAALWHLIESEELLCRLKLSKYDGDLSYLNLIAEAWRTFQQVPRTSHIGDVDVTIHLLDRETGVEGRAFFPDLAGEIFDKQVEARVSKPKLVENIAGDDGILFFISADLKGGALSVVELNAMLPSEVEFIEESNETEENSVGHQAEWQPKLVPEQVRVVQILSDLTRAPFESRRRRLAMIISAWDLTQQMGMDPRTWLATQMPLVSQFLQTNGASFEYEVYGVSAQGVSLDNNMAIDQIAKVQPSRRIRVVSPGSEGNDLTLPLVWLMSK